jgi:hypothetical protein
MDLQITEDERTLLADLVDDAISSIRDEIHHTETYQIRDQLKQREAVLDGLQQKLSAATAS